MFCGLIQCFVSGLYFQNLITKKQHGKCNRKPILTMLRVRVTQERTLTKLQLLANFVDKEQGMIGSN